MSAFDSIDALLREDIGQSNLPSVIREAKRTLANDDPFFSAFLAGLDLIESAEVPIMATDCHTKIFYNRAALESDPVLWDAAMVACVLAHEMMHIIRDDGRAMQRWERPDLANVAMDACINRDLLTAGWTWANVYFWVDPLTDDRPRAPVKNKIAPIATRSDTATTRGIYEHLMRKADDAQQQAQAGAAGAGQQGQQGTGGHPLSGDVNVDAYCDAVAKAGGHAKARQQIERLAQEAAAAAEAAAQDDEAPQAAQSRGGGDEGGGDWSLEKSAAARDLEALGVRIKSPMTRAIRQAGASVRGILRSKTRRQTSMLTPSPLSEDYGRLLPGRRRAKTIRPGIAIDASGSISGYQLQVQTAAAHAWAQIFIGRAQDLPAMFFCTEICCEGTMSKFRPGFSVPGAGGGTSFMWLESWARARDLTHLLIFTDAAGPWPTAVPRDLHVTLVLPKDYMRAHVPIKVTRVELDVPQQR